VALTYELGRIEDYETVCYNKTDVEGMLEMKIETQTIIFGTMVVDLGEITEKNYIEWWQRYNMWCAIKGIKVIDLELVKAHIGLRTNVVTLATHTWMTKRVRQFMQDTENSIRFAENYARQGSRERHPAGKGLNA